jgi:hypothetical protein
MTLLTRVLALFLAWAATTAFAATAPTVAAPTATPGANGAATLTANVTTNGAVTTVTYSYGLTTSYTNTAPATVPDPAVAVPTSVPLTGLIGNQTYHFQVVATNSAGPSAATIDKMFNEPPYNGKPTTGTATTIADTATLHGSVTTNGTKGKVHFEYGLAAVPPVYGTPVTADPEDVGPDDINRAIKASISAGVLARDTVYDFRLVFVPTDPALPTQFGDKAQFRTNNAPVAKTDTVNAAASGPTTINPLVNDTDIDGDPRKLVDVATQPQHGTAVKSGNSIIYTPDAGSTQGFDTFTYTIVDTIAGVDGLSATGTINIRSVRAAFAGTHGGFIKRMNGKEAGYFTVTATSLGTFTGIAIIDGKRFVVSGTISPDGVYRGFATEGGSAIPVFIFTDQTDTGSSVTALFDNGRWSADLTLSPEDRTTRAQALGRYTMEIGAGSTTQGAGNDPGTLPAGTGWGALRVGEDGTAAIKGRLPDGRSYSARGTLGIEDGGAVFTFFDEVGGTRVVGKLALGDTLSGTVGTDHHATGEGRFPRGFEISSDASGAPYTKPPDKRRILDTTAGTKGQDLTISFQGDGLPGTITRQLFLDDNDHVTVLDRAGEGLKMKIDRNSGRWQAKVTIDNEGTRIKATGVFIQPTLTTNATTGVVTVSGTGGRGIGTFNTSTNTGTVTIAAGSTTTTTTGTTTTGTTGTTPVTP